MNERDKNQAQIHICSLEKKREKKKSPRRRGNILDWIIYQSIETPISLYIFIYNLVNFNKNPTNYTSLDRELKSLQSWVKSIELNHKQESYGGTWQSAFLHVA